MVTPRAVIVYYDSLGKNDKDAFMTANISTTISYVSTILLFVALLILDICAGYSWKANTIYRDSQLKFGYS